MRSVYVMTFAVCCLATSYGLGLAQNCPLKCKDCNYILNDGTTAYKFVDADGGLATYCYNGKFVCAPNTGGGKCQLLQPQVIVRRYPCETPSCTDPCPNDRYPGEGQNCTRCSSDYRTVAQTMCQGS